MSAIIKAENLVFSYPDEPEGNPPVLRGIDLEIEEGSFVAILGHNGSGKSTLAKHINALLTPTSGKMTVDGLDTSDPENLLEVRGRVGMVFQNPDNQIVATVVKEDVAFGLENLGVPTEEMIPRIEQALSTVRMNKYADSAPHMLSGGQKQRVAIAGILAMEPSVIIADEATAMLDPSGRREVLETVRMLNRSKGITVLWITHFMEEAALADRVLLVSDGRIVDSGSPTEIFEKIDEMRSLHLDVPRMTALAAELRKEGMPLPSGILTVDHMVQEVKKILCPSKSVT